METSIIWFHTILKISLTFILLPIISMWLILVTFEPGSSLLPYWILPSDNILQYFGCEKGGFKTNVLSLITLTEIKWHIYQFTCSVLFHKSHNFHFIHFSSSFQYFLRGGQCGKTPMYVNLKKFYILMIFCAGTQHKFSVLSTTTLNLTLH